MSKKGTQGTQKAQGSNSKRPNHRNPYYWEGSGLGDRMGKAKERGTPSFKGPTSKRRINKESSTQWGSGK